MGAILFRVQLDGIFFDCRNAQEEDKASEKSAMSAEEEELATGSLGLTPGCAFTPSHRCWGQRPGDTDLERLTLTLSPSLPAL